jgi:hypothetical protein
LLVRPIYEGTQATLRAESKPQEESDGNAELMIKLRGKSSESEAAGFVRWGTTGQG